MALERKGVVVSSHALPALATEQDVVSFCQRQDESGFELLYRNYAAPLREFCRGRLGDSFEAEDACHETLIKAYRAFPRFREGHRVWPWLSTIAAHVCIDIHRARRSVPLDESGEPGQELRFGSRGLGDPHDEVVRRLRADLVGEAMAEIPIRYRAPMHLCDFEGWSYREVADLRGTTVAAVRSSLVRGRRLLRERLHQMAEAGRLALTPALLPLAIMRRIRRASQRRAWAARVAPAWGSLTSVTEVTAGLVTGVVVAAVVTLSLAGVADAVDPRFATAVVQGEGIDDQVPRTAEATPISHESISANVLRVNPTTSGAPGTAALSVSVGEQSEARQVNTGAEASPGATAPIDAPVWVQVDCSGSQVRAVLCGAIDTATE